MRFGWQLAVLVGALPLAPAATFAGSSCYDESPYPAVLRIEAAEGGFRAYTASPDLEKAIRVALELRKRHGWRPDDPGPAYVHPVIGYSKQNGFDPCQPQGCRVTVNRSGRHRLAGGGPLDRRVARLHREAWGSGRACLVQADLLLAIAVA